MIAMTLLPGIFEVGSGRVPGRAIGEVDGLIQNLRSHLRSVEQDREHPTPAP